MACPHPPEERQHVYEGQYEPRRDREWCALCGAILFLADAKVEGRRALGVKASGGP